MKLVFAIVQDDDAIDLVDKLSEKKFGVTKLATTGGFLKSGNTTLFIGVEKEKVPEVISIIEDQCKERESVVPTPQILPGSASPYLSYPMGVKVGGATIFVVDVDQFIKI